MSRAATIDVRRHSRGFGSGFFLVIVFFLLAAAGTAWVYFGMVTTERWPIRWLQVNGSFHRVSAEQLRSHLSATVSGSFFTVNLPQQAVQMALGIMAMTLAILFVVNNQQGGDHTASHYDSSRIRSILPIPMVFGFIMGFLSLGISEWLIPALRNKLGMEMTRAIGTAISMMFPLALVASLVHFSLGSTLHGKIIVLGAIGTLIGGQIGARISQKINDRLLQQSFIYLMTLIGIHLIFQAI